MAGTSMIALLLAATMVIGCTLAEGWRGGHGGGDRDRGQHLRIASCEQDEPVRQKCVADKMKQYGDMDKIKQCFATCQAGKDKGKGKDQWQAKAGASTDANRTAMEAYRKCEQDKKQACIATASKVQLATGERQDDGAAHGGFQLSGGRDADFKGNFKGGFKGQGQGQDDRHDFIKLLLDRADKCNVTVCVRAAIKPELLVNTSQSSATIKKALCQARQSCPASQKCESDRTAVRAAQCTCKTQQAAASASVDACVTPTVQAILAARVSKQQGGGEHQGNGKGDDKHDPCAQQVAKQQPQC